jgi:LPXTG-motif cell wall-anchored protein
VPAADDLTPSDDAPATPAGVTPPVAASTAADLQPVDVDGVGAVLYGTIAWTVALVVALLLRDRLAADGNAWWIWVCLAGALLGLAGLWFVRRRRDAYATKAG